jgi:hypothetical protein
MTLTLGQFGAVTLDPRDGEGSIVRTTVRKRPTEVTSKPVRAAGGYPLGTLPGGEVCKLKNKISNLVT